METGGGGEGGNAGVGTGYVRAELVTLCVLNRPILSVHKITTLFGNVAVPDPGWVKNQDPDTGG
jgi:hypothetical protein